jgi:hypothetical protein
MAESKARDEGDYFPFTQESTTPETSPPAQPEFNQFKPGPGRSLTPRGQRFNDLGEAYRNITLRQGSHNTLRKLSDPFQSSPSVADPNAPTSLLHQSPQVIVRSQDDLQLPDPGMAARNSLKRNHSVDFFGDLSPKMFQGANNRVSFTTQLEREFSEVKRRSELFLKEATWSTIEKILAQYSTNSSEDEFEYDRREVWLSKSHLFPEI